MKSKFQAAFVVCFMVAAAWDSSRALAFCGVIEKSATSFSGQRAAKRALRNLNKDIRDLKQEHGKKLVLDDVVQSCTGGALMIDANGKETEGQSRCTARASYCVNP